MGRENHTKDILHLFQYLVQQKNGKKEGLACKEHLFSLPGSQFLYKSYPILLIIKSSTILSLFLIASVVTTKVGWKGVVQDGWSDTEYGSSKDRQESSLDKQKERELEKWAGQNKQTKKE